uniref:BHLH domain-containing protein n=1 Tax=Trichobilharzia regenti TaxID=157069 RepID=A0AA85IWR7_TRIRE|nr:unnamed protein product [Trichobilharzia regenti]
MNLFYLVCLPILVALLIQDTFSDVNVERSLTERPATAEYIQATEKSTVVHRRRRRPHRMSAAERRVMMRNRIRERVIEMQEMNREERLPTLNQTRENRLAELRMRFESLSHV